MKIESIFLLCAASVLLAGCETVQRTSAAAALPFAAVGDTVILPFQGLGRASERLLLRGADHRARMMEENAGKVTARASANSALVYELPGMALWPFKVATPSELYPMTHACLDAMEPPRVYTTNEPPRANLPRSTPPDEFEEW
jgi:uncharacterized protein YceK